MDKAAAIAAGARLTQLLDAMHAIRTPADEHLSSELRRTRPLHPEAFIPEELFATLHLDGADDLRAELTLGLRMGEIRKVSPAGGRTYQVMMPALHEGLILNGMTFHSPTGLAEALCRLMRAALEFERPVGR